MYNFVLDKCKQTLMQVNDKKCCCTSSVRWRPGL